MKYLRNLEESICKCKKYERSIRDILETLRPISEIYRKYLESKKYENKCVGNYLKV